ncbi:MAG: carotenoid biosynthesis protein [Armatimonadota bacterium]
MPIWLKITLPILAVVGFFVAKVPFDARLAWVSSVAILGFAVPAFAAVLRTWPVRISLPLLAGLSAFAIGIEALSITTGVPYSRFTYSETIGGRLFGLVPWTVPFAWIPLVVGAVARFRGLAGARRVAFAAAYLVGIDLLLDPAAVRLGFWKYVVGSAYYGVPLQNFAGWVLSGGLAAGAIGWVGCGRALPASAMDSLLLIVVFWTSVCCFAGLWIPAIAGIALAMDLVRQRTQGTDRAPLGGN